MTLFYSDSVFGESSSSTSSISKLSPLNNSDSVWVSLEFKVIFENKISDIIFNDVEIDVISNHMLINYKNISKTEYSNQLKVQIHSPVMWSDTIQKIISMNVDNFIEIGPKKTLLNFIPRNFAGEKIAITNYEEVENYVKKKKNFYYWWNRLYWKCNMSIF